MFRILYFEFKFETYKSKKRTTASLKVKKDNSNFCKKKISKSIDKIYLGKHKIRQKSTAKIRLFLPLTFGASFTQKGEKVSRQSFRGEKNTFFTLYRVTVLQHNIQVT